MTEQTTEDVFFESTLARWRDKYTNRRTVPWEMLDEAESIIRSEMSRERRVAKVEANQEVMRLEAKCAHFEEMAEIRQGTIDTMRRTIEMQDKRLQEGAFLHEERQRQEDDVVVRITNGFKGWTVADLEEIAYRMRAGGADDKTKVKIDDHTVSCALIFPDLALELPQQRVTQPNPFASIGEGDLIPDFRKTPVTWPIFLICAVVLAVGLGLFNLVL